MTKRIDEPTIFEQSVQFNILPNVNIDKTKGVGIPKVSNINVLKCVNTGAQNVTNFLGGRDGQRLTVLGDGFTTIIHNVNLIRTTTGANKLLAANTLYEFVYLNNIWYEKA